MNETPIQPAPVVTALHVRELKQVPDALAVVRVLRDLGLPWLLDSALPNASHGRFSFVGADPYLCLRARGGECRLDVRRGVRPDLPPGPEARLGDPLPLVRSLLPPAPSLTRGAARCPVPFVGGAVGYFGYELGTRTQPITLSAADDAGLPDLVLLFVDALVAIDHLEARAWVLGLGFDAPGTNAESVAAARAAEACETLAARLVEVPPVRRARSHGEAVASSLLAPAPEGLETLFDEASYAEAVLDIAGEIEAGNVYQANLSHRMELALPGVDPLRLYADLRELNPAPFAAYLELPEASILSSSPERFLRLDPDGRVESRPIKGTCPRGGTTEEDRRLEQALRDSEKDRAENLMIVDLVRNDLGRVCQIGSVAVPELMAVEPYATVHQMVSTVVGRLRGDCDALDLLHATFPPGSMTGAPKLAAMKIIDRLEPVRRGVYAGALGYLDVRGGLDLSVVIRTLVVAEARARLHVGGAVVADSDPVGEWRETLDKAKALLAALGRVAPRTEQAEPDDERPEATDAASSG